MDSVGIIGFGNMGEAIAKGLSRSENPVELCVLEPVEQKRRKAVDRYRAKAIDHPAELFAETDINVIAIKPQILPEFVANLDGASKGYRFVSVAAGIPLAYYKKKLQTDEIVRFMPNLAAVVGKSLVAMSYEEPIEQGTLDLAYMVADAIGTRLPIPERLMSAVTGVSGSGIAYVFALAHAMSLGGTQAGLPYADSLSAAISTIEGAAELLKSEGVHPMEMLTRVTSPAGTTIEGVSKLEAGGFTGTVMEAVVAAARRADEIERS